MVFILIGAVLIAICAAALAALPFRLRGRKVPRGVPPIAAGIALVVFVLWNDYSWYSRTVGALPDRVTVVESLTYTSPMQPWTYLWPRTNRFSAVDRASIRRNDSLPDFVMTDVLFVQRYQPTLQASQIFDCAAGRRADLTDATQFDDRGMPQNAAWVDLEPDFPLLDIVCGADTVPAE